MLKKLPAMYLIICTAPVLAQGTPGCFVPRYSTEQVKQREKMVQNAQAHFGPDSVQMADALVNLADARLDFESAKATALLRQATSIYERRGKDSAKMADTLCKLADSMQMHGDYESAEQIWIRAERIYGQLKFVDNRGKSRALCGLANGYLSGKNSSAEKAVNSLQQCLKLDQSAYGANSAHVYNDLIMLASAYRLQKRADAESDVTARANKLAKSLGLISAGRGTAVRSNLQDLISAEDGTTTSSLRPPDAR